MPHFFRKLRQSRRPFCSALVAAAGQSSRMGEAGNKLFLPLGGIPVLVHSLQALSQAESVDEIVVATREEDIVSVSDLCHAYGITKPVKIIRGGKSRVESVLLAALEADHRAELLAVHDGARPLVTSALIDDVISKAVRCGAAAPAVPVKDTIKRVDRDGRVEETPDRAGLRAVQTPQVFAADLLKAALQSALDDGAEITDDCSAVERLGKVVYLCQGSEENLKITTPVDLLFAEAILQERWEQH
jgi:2-C-methyl-D-erythritol 4-phosphate cytidylyltransferase